MKPFDPQGEVPAIDIAGTYGFLNSAFDPAASPTSRGRRSPRARRTQLRDEIARHIDGLANLFTAAICTATHGRPTAVCQSSGVRSAGAAHLH